MVNFFSNLSGLFSITFCVLLLLSFLFVLFNKPFSRRTIINFSFFFAVLICSVVFKFISKRYILILFLPSIVFIGSFFDSIIKKSSILYLFLIAFVSFPLFIKLFFHLSLPGYSYYLNQVPISKDSPKFYFSDPNDINERNRLSYYLNKEIISYPTILSCFQNDFISSNHPFYFVFRNQSNSLDTYFGNHVREFSREIIHFYVNNNKKKSIQIVESNSLSNILPYSYKDRDFSFENVFVDDLSSINSEYSTDFLKIDFAPKNSISVADLQSEASRPIILRQHSLSINSPHQYVHYFVRALPLSDSYRLSLKLQSSDNGIVLLTIYYYDNKSAFITSCVFIYIIQKSSTPIDVSYFISTNASPRNAAFCRPHISFLGDVDFYQISVDSFKE